MNLTELPNEVLQMVAERVCSIKETLSLRETCHLLKAAADCRLKVGMTISLKYVTLDTKRGLKMRHLFMLGFGPVNDPQTSYISIHVRSRYHVENLIDQTSLGIAFWISRVKRFSMLSNCYKQKMIHIASCFFCYVLSAFELGSPPPSNFEIYLQNVNVKSRHIRKMLHRINQAVNLNFTVVIDLFTAYRWPMRNPIYLCEKFTSIGYKASSDDYSPDRLIQCSPDIKLDNFEIFGDNIRTFWTSDRFTDCFYDNSVSLRSLTLSQVKLDVTLWATFPLTKLECLKLRKCDFSCCNEDSPPIITFEINQLEICDTVIPKYLYFPMLEELEVWMGITNFDCFPASYRLPVLKYCYSNIQFLPVNGDQLAVLLYQIDMFIEEMTVACRRLKDLQFVSYGFHRAAEPNQLSGLSNNQIYFPWAV